jgi:hypothetical protein
MRFSEESCRNDRRDQSEAKTVETGRGAMILSVSGTSQNGP